MSGDPYLYPNTNVLRNLKGITTNRELDNFERMMTTAAMKTLPRVDVTYEGLRQIHEHLFRKVYDFAGKERTIRFGKQPEDGADPVMFVAPKLLEGQTNALFERVRADQGLRTASIPDFAEALAPHLHRLNMIHPFREGNGRTQRLMMERIAETNGQRLDFGHITAERMNRDSIDAALANDPKPLANLLRDAANPITKIEMIRVITAFEGAYGKGQMEGFYITSGRIGEEIKGQLAIADPLGMVVIADNRTNRLTIGERADLADPKAEMGDDATLKPSAASIGNRVVRFMDKVPEQLARKVPPLVQAMKAMETVRTLAEEQPPKIKTDILQRAPSQIAQAINEGKNPVKIAPKIANQPRPKAGPKAGPAM